MEIFQDEKSHMEIFERIQSLVDGEGVSGKEFARRADIPYGTFYKYMKGTAEPSASTIRKICSYKGISSDWLLFGDAKKSPENSLDEGRLVRIIAQVESLLDDNNLSLSPDKKAKMIALLYQLFDVEGVVDDAKVVQFLRLAS